MKLAPAYQPQEHEAKIYQLWQKSGVFTANPTSDKPRFSISMPPPNETGTLHAGHAIGLTLQDVMSRYARQKGMDVLWLPGTDHAALATNAIIENRLAEQGTNKHELGREKFIEVVKEFVTASRDTMNAQIKAMGASCDWGRARYTLDDALNRCVNEVFVKMYHDGLIYRGHRIVNWDPKLETTVSDDEVVHIDQKTPLYTLKFGPFQITTARPETKFGDKYVVMHPDDERYKQYQSGQTFETEWINGKITATVVKDEAVDPAFGTGVMTITPWHDHTDFEIAERHGLEKVQVIDFDGRLLPIAGDYAGMTIEEARPKIVAKLQAKGLVIDINHKYEHSIALNDRGKGVIEPQIKLQWFLDVNRPAIEWKGQLRSFKEVMRAVIEDGDIKIVPSQFEKVYFHWIDNLRDWNISRQIWWGHRVPIWYKGDEIYSGVNAPEGQGWQQDPDTLDTWFSSALWTWSTLVDPKLAADLELSLDEILQQSQDFKTYHPTSVMETGWDILFFWVARMILATTYATGQVPFKTVYLHGLVRTETGKKMSKSDPEGSVDPTEVIAEYGADALRLALISGTAPGADQRLGKAKIMASRNFNNKLWNIARYVQSLPATSPTQPKTAADHWILNKLSISADNISNSLDSYRFSDAYDYLYHFVWDDLADWYIEASKIKNAVSPGLLKTVLEDSLRLAHPFAPFVTEAIWGQLEKDGLLAAELTPQPAKSDMAEATKFERAKETVEAIRAINGSTEVKISQLIFNHGLDEELLPLVKKLAGLSAVEKGQRPVDGWQLPIDGVEAWVVMDKTETANYKNSLSDKIELLKNEVIQLEKRLANKQYAANAPEELVEETKKALAAKRELAAKLSSELKG